jgi:High-affinity nickel-transport protein
MERTAIGAASAGVTDQRPDLAGDAVVAEPQLGPSGDDRALGLTVGERAPVRIRKLYYNLTMTFISIVVAFLIGGLEALSLQASSVSREASGIS